VNTQRSGARRRIHAAVAGLLILVVIAISLLPSSSSGPAYGRLKFAIAPGSAPATPSEVAKTMTALRQLKASGKPLVLHLYSGYTGPQPWPKYRALLGRELSAFERAGFDVELVLRFAPLGDRGSPRDVRAFAALVRRIVGAFGGSPRFTSVQITNEADLSRSAASDGHFNRGFAAWQALIQGVVAAKATARAHHFEQLKVGFNFATDGRAMWRYLGHHAGAAFTRALDWVGIDTYPGTLTPLPKDRLQPGIAVAIKQAIHQTRHVDLPLARIPDKVALHFSENGYATSVGHSYDMQATALRTAVDTIALLSTSEHVTEYDWFELRDPTDSKLRPVDQFGLLRQDYRPKPAFDIYRRLIQTLS
jgi:hypothetical protein